MENERAQEREGDREGGEADRQIVDKGTDRQKLNISFNLFNRSQM
jgi:hypothetical protein